MKMVLTAFSDALIAGKSEIVTPQIPTDETQMKGGDKHTLQKSV
jgi:hypothetical protein